MGSTQSEPDSGPDEYPQHTVMLDAFWMDQTEVTNERYQRCVAAGSTVRKEKEKNVKIKATYSK